MNTKQIGGTFLILVGLTLAVCMIFNYIQSEYTYEKDVLSSWNLADKSSTLEAKSIYINQFIYALEMSNLPEYNAIFLKTPDNNIQNNLNAVKTLSLRLEEIKDLDPESFAYQTAIQQITSQEQGEAQVMLSVLKEGWKLTNGYWIVWSWVGVLFLLISLIMILVGSILIIGEA